MAIVPGISLAVRGPDIGDIFSNALITAQRAQTLKQGPTRNRLLEAQTSQAESGATQASQLNRIRSLALFGSEIQGDLQSGNLEAIRAKTLQRIEGLPGRGLPNNDSIELLQMLDDPNVSREAKLQNINQLANNANQRAIQFGAIQGLGGGLTSKQREFGGFTEGLSEEDIQRARRIELGLDPRAVSSAAITAATTPGLADKVIGFEGDKAGEIESARLSVRKTIKPQIEAAITKARLEAQNRGEILTDLSRAKAALPGLKEVTGKLRELSPLVSSTLGGRLFNAAVKETGFGATKGSTARAKFIAIVDNEVLPLLKATFGAAFTVQEGEALKATLGNPNASPEEKSAQIDAFIDSKMRQIETLEREASETQDRGAGEIMVDAQGNRARVFPDGSIEEL